MSTVVKQHTIRWQTQLHIFSCPSKLKHIINKYTVKFLYIYKKIELCCLERETGLKNHRKKHFHTHCRIYSHLCHNNKSDLTDNKQLYSISMRAKWKMSDTDTHRQQMFRETKKDKHSSVQMIWCRLPATIYGQTLSSIHRRGLNLVPD